MKRRTRLPWLALPVVIAVCAAAAAAGGGGGGAAGSTAEDRARELRLTEAKLRVEAARMALQTAQAQVEEGLATQQVMVERELDVVRAERALAEAEAEARARQEVSLRVKDASLADTFGLLFKDTDQSFVMHPALHDRADRITITLKDVRLDNAVRMICKLYGLEYETDNAGLWVILPSSDFVTVGGRDVPLLGATSVDISRGITVARGTGGPSRIVMRADDEPATAIYYGGQAPAEFEGRTNLARIGLSDLVDLQAEDTPLSEVAAQLGVKRDGEWQVEVLVHEAVPEDIKVTAKVYRVRRDDLLVMLAEQANLDISVDSSPETHTKVYFVPKPELCVSGPALAALSSTLGPYFETRASDVRWLRRDAEDAEKRAEDVLRKMRIETDKGVTVSVMKGCPECEASVLLPDWKFCPHCGAQVVSEEKQPEER